MHTITYMYTEANGCSASASDEVEVKEATLVITSIDDINDVNANGVALNLGEEVALQGIVYCGNFSEINFSQSTFWIIEPSGDGILVISEEEHQVSEGDEVIIEGTIGQLRRHLTITASEITEVSENNELQIPVPTDSLTESLESKYVTLEINDADPAEVTLTAFTNGSLLRFPSASQGLLRVYAFNSTGISFEFLNTYISNLDIGTYLMTGIVYEEDGTYFLLPCSESDFDFLTSADEPAWANEIVVFPNPTSNEVNVRSSVDIEEWQLIDLQGRVLRRGTNKMQRFVVDLSEWPSGLYRLQLINGKEAVQRPVIKQ